jgi:hypothetical protein
MSVTSVNSTQGCVVEAGLAPEADGRDVQHATDLCLCREPSNEESAIVSVELL